MVTPNSSSRPETFKAIRAEVLRIGGSKSGAYLKADLDALATIVPRARRIEFAGLNHAATWNSDRGGKPGPVAEELRRFFAEGP